TGSHDEMVEQAIRLAEERGYTVVRNDAGGCCEVTEYSDGTVAVGITVERRALGMERLSLGRDEFAAAQAQSLDRKSTRLNSSHVKNSYAVFCLKKKNTSRG